MAGEKRFWRRYGPLFRRIQWEYPVFWEELRDVAERHQEGCYTARDARVQDWPESRSVGVQMGAPLAARRDVATQVDRRSTPEPVPRPMLRMPATSRGDQRDEEEMPGENWDDPRPAAPRRDRLEDGEDEWDYQTMPRGRGPGCWNCGSRIHHYSACPQPRRVFCYGCGREGVTLRECERCAEGWRRLGPYHPDRGHMHRRRE